MFSSLQLKAYAAAQGVILNFKTTEHIGYSLNSDSISGRNIWLYGYGYAFYAYFIIGPILYFCFVFVIMVDSKNTVEKLSKITIDQIKVWKIFCCVAVITMLLELSFEFVWSVVWSVNVHTPNSIVYIWVTYLLTKFVPSMLLLLSLVCCYAFNFGFNALLLVVLLMLGIMVYWFALPTFLFLLVYPINVVAIFSYMAAFMFTLIVSITIAWSGLEKLRRGDHTKCAKCGKGNVLFTAISMLIYLFLVLVIILYIVAIGKTSVITFSFYGVLSLLPSVAITAVSWMFKNKLFKEGDEDNEPGNENNEPDTEPGASSEYHPLIDTQHTNVGGTDVQQRTQYQTMGEQST